jgi:1-deoxy-D-xylulose-5-phosphate reductoisomerase
MVGVRDNGGMARRDVVVLGSTGSVGTQALDVIRRHPDRFRVVGLAAGGSQPELLARQAIEVEAPVVGVSRGSAAEDVQLALYAHAKREGFGAGEYAMPRLLAGPEAPAQVAALPADVVLNAITGSAGLSATLATLDAGTTLALANKESLIIGGDIVTSAARPGQIVPVDSEHSAIAQCLRSGRASEVRRLVLTASGGPFVDRDRAELADVSPEQALSHPNFDMGPVITVNSATLMNKGLEVIEAHLLFGVAMDDVHVVVHPQQLIHSMVEFVDGSTIAQASPPTMLIPIALGLSWPDRVDEVAPACDWSAAATWTFQPLDDAAFPAIELARLAGRHGRTAPAVLNAANEVCVDAFLRGELPFLDIVDTVRDVLDEHLRGAGSDEHVPSKPTPVTVDEVLAADAWARDRAQGLAAHERVRGRI